MGYDTERFVNSVNEGLKCSICRAVLEDPLQAPCEHAFCSSCIQKWLTLHDNCPEDRQPLDQSNLQPLNRYMKNELNRLQLHCRNKEYGCEMVCSLESIDRHEHKCKYNQIPTLNADSQRRLRNGSLPCSYGCSVHVEWCLDSHVAENEDQGQEYPSCSGYSIPQAENALHSCAFCSQLRTEINMLWSDMVYRIEKAKCEMEFRLDSQRREMQKQSFLQNEIDELKTQMSQMMSVIHNLMATERQQRQELEQVLTEKQELLEELMNCRLTQDINRKVANFQPRTQLESINQNLRGYSHVKPHPKFLPPLNNYQ
ncbi:E3 ubiquitin-protein ligase NRDP1-like [Eublepharis macularius]|uniref:E3 ubiquitin-protein ligase NRDP1-like n=1 Tax=Eublepharis macularius TaxID=481883 RepID=A0AA97JNG6_EUBMA|nr:E3 ubiquitin-protein ligase NRDP1-like [Eublepharis macularius]